MADEETRPQTADDPPITNPLAGKSVRELNEELVPQFAAIMTAFREANWQFESERLPKMFPLPTIEEQP